MKRVRVGQIVVFTRQLATLVSAGMPLVKGLYTLHSQIEPGYFKQVVLSIAKDVEAGTNFSESLGHYSSIFPQVYISMVKAGEMSGTLDIILRRLAILLEKQSRLRHKIKSSLSYPIFILSISIIILTLLVTFVVPTFVNMFNEIGAVLPLATLILIKVSNAIRFHWYIIVLAALSMFFLLKFILRKPRIRYLMDKLILRLPIFGPLISNIIIARFSRIFSTLLTSGVSILDALYTVSDIVGNEKIRRGILYVLHSIKEGEGIAQPLESAHIFPPIVVKMVAIGEETGTLDNVLSQIADSFEEDVDVAITGLTSLLEPLLIVFMGLIVGFIVISMFMPLFSLARLI